MQDPIRRFNVFVIFVFLLYACAAEAPAAAPTRIPLASVDLEPLLVQSGDLPAGMTGAQVKDAAPPAFKRYPLPTKAIDQRFQRSGDVVGGVVVLLYENAADRDAAWAQAQQAITSSATPLPDVGEQALLLASSPQLPITSATFRRCAAIVDIGMDAQVQPNEISAYARRLDTRLTPLVC